MHNVILIGMPGVGKSTLGVLLAKTLGMTFLDTDLVIQDQKKALLRELARIALERGCGRLEWACLDWNRPSIDFYLSVHAQPMEEWTTYRLTGKTLEDMAK